MTLFNDLAAEPALTKTVTSLKTKKYKTFVADTKEAALEKIKELIPQGSSVMNGSSTTLDEIGFIEYLKSESHGWQNKHAEIVTQQDPALQASLRKQALLAEYYLGSVHAITENGEMIIASNTGSQLPHLAYSSDHLILVIGTQKIVKNIDEGMKRLREHVLPLENERLLNAYGVNTKLSKVLLFLDESDFSKREITIIFVKEKLGF